MSSSSLSNSSLRARILFCRLSMFGSMSRFHSSIEVLKPCAPSLMVGTACFDTVTMSFFNAILSVLICPIACFAHLPVSFISRRRSAPDFGVDSNIAEPAARLPTVNPAMNDLILPTHSTSRFLFPKDLYKVYCTRCGHKIKQGGNGRGCTLVLFHWSRFFGAGLCENVENPNVLV